MWIGASWFVGCEAVLQMFARQKRATGSRGLHSFAHAWALQHKTKTKPALATSASIPQFHLRATCHCRALDFFAANRRSVGHCARPPAVLLAQTAALKAGSWRGLCLLLQRHRAFVHVCELGPSQQVSACPTHCASTMISCDACVHARGTRTARRSSTGVLCRRSRLSLRLSRRLGLAQS